MLHTPDDGLQIPPDLQKKLDTVRANVSLNEQEAIRWRNVAKDQEAVVRSFIEKEEQVKANIADLEVKQEGLTQSVGELEGKKLELTSDLASLSRVLADKEREKKDLEKEIADLIDARKTERTLMKDEREKHEAYLRDSDQKNNEKTKVALDLEDRIAKKKELALSILKEL